MRRRAQCSSTAATRARWCRWWRRRRRAVSFIRGVDRVLWGADAVEIEAWKCSTWRARARFRALRSMSRRVEREELRAERRWCGSRSRTGSLGRLWRARGRTAKWFCSIRRWEKEGGVRDSRMRWRGGLRRGTVFMICSSVAVGRSWAWPRSIRRFICWIFAFKCAVVCCLLGNELGCNDLRYCCGWWEGCEDSENSSGWGLHGQEYWGSIEKVESESVDLLHNNRI